MLQEPVQVKTHRQFVVTSQEQSIYESRTLFSVPASATGTVRGVRSLPRLQAPLPAADRTERFIDVMCVKINPIITMTFGSVEGTSGSRLIYRASTIANISLVPLQTGSARLLLEISDIKVMLVSVYK